MAAPASSPSFAREHAFGVYATLVCGLAVAVLAWTASTDRLVAAPWLFVALLACAVVLDLLDVDVFGRANLTPATVPVIALACVFGPLGPMTAELISVLSMVLRRRASARTLFDLGALTLCGAAAAATAAVLPTDGAWMLLLGGAAGLAYYAANCVLLAGAWVLNEGLNPLAAWREGAAWAAPHYLGYGVLAGLVLLAERQAGLIVFAIAALPFLVLWLGQKQYVDRTRSSVEQLRESHAELEAANAQLRTLLDEKHELLERVRRSGIATVTSLARTIEAKDPYTRGHVERVSDYAVELARELDFGPAEIEAVAIGGVIHDIGKVGVRDDVLLKRGKLTEDEWIEMRSHAERASYILGDLDLAQLAKDMARHHHERYDGRGYPDGLAGEEIPLAARILTVADTLDAMTTHRPYRAALSVQEALDEVRDNAGTQFCPEVVAALERHYARHPGYWRDAQASVDAAAVAA